MIRKKIMILLACTLMVASCAGCVDQSSGENGDDGGSANSDGSLRLIATSPAAADICDRLELELVGVCDTTVSTIPERYSNVEKVGMPMSPDLEILKSLTPDYVLSPNSLQNDLQPKYASAGLSSIFLNLKSVEGMYASIEDLGEKFGRQEQAADLIEEYEKFMEEYRSASEGRESPRGPCQVVVEFLLDKLLVLSF